MKLISLALGLLFLSTPAFSVAPLGVSGQGDTSNQYPPVVKVPNKQATPVVGGTLLETGNNNLLANPSFEHSTFNTGWTCTGVTPVVETTIVAPGSKKSMKLTLSASTGECYQDSTIGAAYASNVQFLAMMRAKASVSVGTVKVCARQAGVTSTSLCNSNTEDNFNYKEMPFKGSTTSNGISFVFTGATGTVYLDDAFVGPTQLRQISDGTRLLGTLQYPGQTSCTWQTSSTTLANFAADTDCATPNVSGVVQAPSTKIPAFVLPDGTPTGELMVVMNASITGTSSGNVCSYRITDGTNNSFISSAADIDTAAGSLGAATYRIPRTSTGATTYQLQASCDAGTTSVNNASANRYETAFTVYLVNSNSTYSSTNADTSWAPCTFSSLTWQGLGTVTNTSLRCKRDGDDLLMRGRFTTGTVAAAVAQMPLPLWNGLQLTSSAAIGTNETSNAFFRSVANTSTLGSIVLQPSVTYVNFVAAIVATTNNPTIPLNGTNLFGSGEGVEVTNLRIPIKDWENSNITIAQLSGLESCTTTLSCVESVSAKVSSTDVVSDEDYNSWINGNCTNATSGRGTCTYDTGIFTQTPNCTVTTSSSAMAFIVSESSTAITYETRNSAGVAADASVTISCKRTGADAVFKTARAVSSDANDRTPGVTNFVSFFVNYSGATDTTNCASSPCTTTESYGQDWVNGSITRSSAGQYVVTSNAVFNPNSWVTCYYSNMDSAAPSFTNDGGHVGSFKANSSGIITATIRSWNASGTSFDSYGQMKCEGQAK